MQFLLCVSFSQVNLDRLLNVLVGGVKEGAWFAIFEVPLQNLRIC